MSVGETSLTKRGLPFKRRQGRNNCGIAQKQRAKNEQGKNGITRAHEDIDEVVVLQVDRAKAHEKVEQKGRDAKLADS